MDAPAKKKRRPKPINGLSLEIMDAMTREYGEWQARVQAADPSMPPALSEDEKWMLESGRLPQATVTKLRLAIFEDLVRRGYRKAEVCQRLLISRKSYSKLSLHAFGVDDPKLVRAECSARALERIGQVKAEIDRMDKMRQDRQFKDRVFTSAERESYFKLIKLGNDLDESYLHMHAANAPQVTEHVETKTVSIELTIAGTRERLASVLDNPQVIDAISEPAMLLPSDTPEPAHGS